MAKARNLGSLVSQGSILADNAIQYNEIQGTPPIPAVLKGTSITYPGNDLAADPAGGQTITINGTGFEATPTVYIGGVVASSVTFVSSTQITFVAPARTAGTYDIYIVNPGGATAIMVFGISYSGLPTWTTPAGSLGEVDGTFSVQLQASSNSAVTYALANGSTLPSGITLSSSGLLSGTTNVEQTFSFTAVATDLENQDTPRSFQVTVVLGDPLFDYNVLLLAGNGTNGAQNNTFIDSSPNNTSITRSGNVMQGAFSPYGSNWSNYFDGNGDYLRVGNNAAFDFGTSDFTIEAWIYDLGDSEGDILAQPQPSAQAADGLSLYKSAAGTIGLYAAASSGAYAVAITGTIQQNTWTHVAGTRSGNVFTLWINGVSAGTATSSVTITQSATAGYGGFQVGAGYTGSVAFPYTGYISNARVVKGTAVYTAAFTPPSAPLTAITNTSLLTCQSNRFRDASTNNFTITRNGDVSVQRFSPFNPTGEYSTTTIGSSGYFDGASSLQAPVSSAWAFGTGDFTVEGWFYISASSASSIAITNRQPAGGRNGTWALYMSTTGFSFVELVVGGTGVSASANLANQWMHIAITRQGTDLRAFVNGVLTATTTNYSINFNDVTWPLRVGTSPNENFYTGYMAGVRVVKGTALYTSNFTVPTAPISSVTNTQLLLNFANAGVIDSTAINNIDTVGSAQISTAQSRFGGSSILFDGTDDRLTTPANPGLAFGTGDFTVEFWMNSNNVAGTAQRGLLQTSDTVGGLKTTYTSGITIHQGINASQGAMNGGLGANIAGTFIGSNTAVLNTGTWYHIALVRLNGTVTIYVNGAVHASGTANGNCSGQFICIGGYYDTNYLYNGYIDDLRITDLARYSTSFTAPTIAHKLR